MNTARVHYRGGSNRSLSGLVRIRHTCERANHGRLPMLTKRDFLLSVSLAAITAATAKSGPLQAETSTDRPGFFKAKDIAEAGFIYGLPIVMNYGVMYEYAVDRSSGQFKAPFNQIKNEPNVLRIKTLPFPRRTATRPIRSYGWICGQSPSSFRSRRWTRSATTRSCFATAIPTTTAISAAVPPEANQATTWWSGRTGRARPPARDQEGVPVEHTVFRGGISHPAFQP